MSRTQRTPLALVAVLLASSLGAISWWALRTQEDGTTTLAGAPPAVLPTAEEPLSSDSALEPLERDRDTLDGALGARDGAGQESTAEVAIAAKERTKVESASPSKKKPEEAAPEYELPTWTLRVDVDPLDQDEAPQARVFLRVDGRSLGGGALDESGVFELEITHLPRMSDGSEFSVEVDHPDFARKTQTYDCLTLFGPEGQTRHPSLVPVSVFLERPHARVKGRISHERGVRTEVAAFVVQRDGWPALSPVDYQLVNDKAFELRLPDRESYWILAWAENHRVEAQLVDARARRVIGLDPIRMTSPISLRARLMGPKEYQISGLVVHGRPRMQASRTLRWHDVLTDGEVFSPQWATDQTDEDGAFELRGLPAAQLDLYGANVPGIGLVPPVSLGRYRPTTTTFDLRLPVTRLEFYVYGAEGPLQDARVGLLIGELETRLSTGKEGKAHAFVSSRETGQLLVEADGYLPSSTPLSRHRPADTVGRSIELLPAQSGSGCSLEIEADPEGLPLPDRLLIRVLPKGARLAHQGWVTVEKGRGFLSGLPKGDVRITLWDADLESYLVPQSTMSHLEAGRTTTWKPRMVKGGRVRLLPTLPATRQKVTVDLTSTALYLPTKNGQPQELPQLPIHQRSTKLQLQAQRIHLVQDQPWVSRSALPPGNHPLVFESSHLATQVIYAPVKAGEEVQISLPVSTWFGGL